MLSVAALQEIVALPLASVTVGLVGVDGATVSVTTSEVAGEVALVFPAASRAVTV